MRRFTASPTSASGPRRARAGLREAWLSAALACTLGACAAPVARVAPADSAAAGTAADATQRCQALLGEAIGDGGARVSEAVPTPARGDEPEYCIVRAQLADSALRIEVRLPTEGWNRRLAFIGGGGFDGFLLAPNTPPLNLSPSIWRERYATVTTNGGYDHPGAPDLNYFKASFASDPKRLVDFTFESEHRGLPYGKAIISRYYGAGPERSYFEGCSMGGHDALIEAQRYPGDFDGIVARAPAGNVMGLMLQFHRISQLALKPGHALDEAQQAMLAKAVLAQCDTLDGVGDGIIANLAACRFDPATLRCPAGKAGGAHCLGDPQLALVKAVTSPLESAGGKWSHPGYPHGGEDSPEGWGMYVWPLAALGGTSRHALFSDGFLRAFIARDAALDTSQWQPAHSLPELDIIGSLFNATDPDLSRMHARGAKLLIWNGTTDTSVSVRDSARYYAAVVQAMGQAAADETIEFFQAPGVGHCYGGAGPDKVDLMQAMTAWVEKGTPPSQQGVVQRKLDAEGNTVLSRPLCRYPAYARYRGTGADTEAANFDCAMP